MYDDVTRACTLFKRDQEDGSDVEPIKSALAPWRVKGADARGWFFPASRYDIAVADVPWAYYGSRTKMGAAAKHYSCMADTEVGSFPMRAFLNRVAVLFLWATSPRLDFAVHCIETWGLHYRGIAFEWIKTKKDGTPIDAQGVRPSLTKPVIEYVLAASTVKRGRPLPLCDEAVDRLCTSRVWSTQENRMR